MVTVAIVFDLSVLSVTTLRCVEGSALVCSLMLSSKTRKRHAGTLPPPPVD
jgi:hypothetical protein